MVEPPCPTPDPRPHMQVGILAEARVVRIVRVRPVGGVSLALLQVKVWAEDVWVCERDCQYGTCAVRQGGAEGRGGAREGEEICVCDADWIGRDCDVHTMMTWRYLPFVSIKPFVSHLSSPHAGPRGGGGEGGHKDVSHKDVSSFWDQGLMDTALQELHASQHPPTCTPRTALQLRFENRGAAATINYVAGLLGMAHVQGRALVLSQDDPWVYAHNEGCVDFECYFQV